MATSAFPSEGMELTHILVVGDAGRSRDFYRDVLGAELFRVPDCRAAYETLLGRGAEFLTPPVDYEWEVRCFFRDPDGHLLEISESKPPADGS